MKIKEIYTLHDIYFFIRFHTTDSYIRGTIYTPVIIVDMINAIVGDIYED